MATKEDVETLLLHYKMLRGDIGLLIQFCGMRSCSLWDGFKDVLDEIAALEKQLAEMK